MEKEKTTLEMFMEFMRENNYYIGQNLVDYYWELRTLDEKRKNQENNNSYEPIY